MDNVNYTERLNRLLDVALAHEEHDGEETPLNGGCFDLNMGSWKCGTSACLLGSYVLTDYGKRFFDWTPGSMPEPELRENNSGDPYQGAAIHFGISIEDSLWLFNPLEYDSNDRDMARRHSVRPSAVTRRVRDVIERYMDES